MAMLCSEFLEYYSDYRDGLITDEQLSRRLYHHLLRCPRCMRYDALVSRGVIALRATSDLEPSWRFRRELRKRVAAETRAWQAGRPVRSAPAGVMAGLMAAGTLLLLGWAGVTLLRTRADSAPVAISPERTPVIAVANPSAPFVTFTDLRPPPFRTLSAERPPELSFATWVTLGR